MDFNDLSSRLERVYAAIGSKVDGDVQRYVKVTVDGQIAGTQYDAVLTFDGGQSNAQIENVVSTTTEHLAKLKDHLKNRLGEKKNLVEEKINDSLELQLVMDLSNAEKHGYPLDTERSNRSPRMQNIQTSLVVPPQEQVGINLKTGEIVELGNCYIEIQGEVVDNNGEMIYRWPKLVEKALEEWERFINENNLT